MMRDKIAAEVLKDQLSRFSQLRLGRIKDCVGDPWIVENHGFEGALARKRLIRDLRPNLVTVRIRDETLDRFAGKPVHPALFNPEA